MTRTYAARRLLEHGPLTRSQLRDITGWRDSIVTSAIDRLLAKGVVQRVNMDGKRHYALTESA